jgi:hypothetical protein
VVFPCGGETLTRNLPTGVTTGSSATNRHPLWYESQTGNTEYTLFDLIGAATHIFSTNELCCPVLEYKLYKDV